MEVLKKLHIPFKTKVKVQGREIDFLIGKCAIEIDSHLQDATKNIMLLNEGYTPYHFDNNFDSAQVEEWLKKLWQTS